jgi:hypothetical protein
MIPTRTEFLVGDSGLSRNDLGGSTNRLDVDRNQGSRVGCRTRHRFALPSFIPTDANDPDDLACPKCQSQRTVMTIETRKSQMRLCLDCRLIFTVLSGLPPKPS